MKLAPLLLTAGGLCALAANPTELPTNLKILKDLFDNSPEDILAHIEATPLKAKIVREVEMSTSSMSLDSALPTVTGHGMGDSCFEPGMKSITKGIGSRTGSYAVCIPTGNNILSDTINGFLMPMDKSIDVFAAKIRADPKLAGGFNAIGFSQGNSLIRGYIHRYNDPPVNTFISVHGTVMGVAAFPQCFQQGKPLGLICKALAEVLGDLAYNGLVQNILFQADYYRDPKRTNSQAYLKHSQIARWNNEDSTNVNATYTANFGKVKKFAMVKALKDSMVFPNQCEHWGSEPDGSFGEPLTMNETKFYKQNLFGLKDADAAGKIFYETTPGDHLQFSDKELYGWVDKYFLGKTDAPEIQV